MTFALHKLLGGVSGLPKLLASTRLLQIKCGKAHFAALATGENPARALELLSGDFRAKPALA